MMPDNRKKYINIFMPPCCAIITLCCLYLSGNAYDIADVISKTAYITAFEILLCFFLEFGPQAEFSRKKFSIQLIILEAVFSLSLALFNLPFLYAVFMLSVVMLTGLMRLDIGIITFAAGVLYYSIYSGNASDYTLVILMTFSMCILIYAIRTKAELVFAEIALLIILLIYDVIYIGLDFKLLLSEENIIMAVSVVVIFGTAAVIKLKYICYSWNLSKNRQSIEKFIESNEINETKKLMYASTENEAQLDDSTETETIDIDTALNPEPDLPKEPEESEADRLRIMYEQTCSELSRLRFDYSTVNDNLTAVKKQLEDKKLELEDKDRQINELENGYISLDDDYKGQKAEYSVLQDSIRKKEEELSELKQRISSLENRLKKNETEKKRISEAYEAIEAEYREIEEKQRALEESYSQARSGIYKLEKEKQILEEKNASLEEICEDSLSRIRELEDTITELKGDEAAVSETSAEQEEL